MTYPKEKKKGKRRLVETIVEMEEGKKGRGVGHADAPIRSRTVPKKKKMGRRLMLCSEKGESGGEKGTDLVGGGRSENTGKSEGFEGGLLFSPKKSKYLIFTQVLRKKGGGGFVEWERASMGKNEIRRGKEGWERTVI